MVFMEMTSNGREDCTHQQEITDLDHHPRDERDEDLKDSLGPSDQSILKKLISLDADWKMRRIKEDLSRQRSLNFKMSFLTVHLMMQRKESQQLVVLASQEMEMKRTLVTDERERSRRRRRRNLSGLTWNLPTLSTYLLSTENGLQKSLDSSLQLKIPQ